MAVDPTNPGQFFACCGLLELADRLWLGAEGWFEGQEFKIAFSKEQGTLQTLLTKLSLATLESSLTDAGVKRLGTLLSKAKSKLTKQDQEDKARLQEMWQRERLHLSAPFDLLLYWWWDKTLKTWAAKQFVIEISRPMLAAIATMTWTDQTRTHCLNQTAKLRAPPFYFDAANNTQNTPRDNGFAPDEVKRAAIDRPLLEVLAFIGLERCRPRRVENSELLQYTTWATPLPLAVVAAATLGELQLVGDRTYEFRMLFRTEYMKAILPSQLVRENS